MSDGNRLVFETPEYKGFSIRASYLNDGQNARVEVVRAGTVIQTSLYPAYKIWNVAAHAEDIIDEGEAGWALAGSDLLGGGVMPKETR